MNLRRWLLLGSVCVLVAGCSSGRAGTETGADSAEASDAASSECQDAELEATDIGITEDTITIEVVADTGSPAIPGMANGSVEAVEAWAKLVNDNGGLACRQVEVRKFDSRIDPNESRNGMVDSCQSAFAMVGSFMLAAADATPIAECADINGEQTGLPDVTASALNPLIVCNPTSFFITSTGPPCPPGQGEQTFTVATAPGDYIKQLIGGEGIGFYQIGYSSPQLLAGTMPRIQEFRNQGLEGEVHGARGSDPQTAKTAPVQQIKAADAQFVYNDATFPSFLLLQKEAQAQGVDVPHWICLTTCYDANYPKTAGDLATGVQVILTTLPYEEADVNEGMKAFTDNVQTRNVFSMSSWLAAKLFQQAVETAVEKDGPNGLTRQSIVAALNDVKDFTADGMIGPSTPADRQPTGCLVVVEVQDDGSFARVFPEEPGTLECGDFDEVTIDPIAAFSG